MKVFVGFDGREKDAYLVAAHTLRKHASIQIEVEPLVLEQLRWKRLYNRPHEMRDGRVWDAISRAPMATEFALTRFLVPHLVGYRGWALFVDCDFLFRADVAELFALANPAFAVQVVKRTQQALDCRKMDGQLQTNYARKNWSSCMLLNCAHDAHAGTLERVNRWRGLWLHQFRHLQEAEDIGDLPLEWNWLEGIDRPLEPTASHKGPKAVHFTRGIPSMPGYEDSAYADEWRAALAEATHDRVEAIY